MAAVTLYLAPIKHSSETRAVLKLSYRTYLLLISCQPLLPPNHTFLLEIQQLVTYWGKFLAAKT